MRFRRPGGKSCKLTLGRYDAGGEPTDEPVIGGPLTLAMARQLAASIARQRMRGVDVVAEQKAEKERRRSENETRVANAFGTAVREFFIDHKTRWGARPRRWRSDALLGLNWPRGCDPGTIEPRIISGGLADIWRDKLVTEIDAHSIHVIIDQTRKHGIPGLLGRNARRNGVRRQDRPRLGRGLWARPRYAKRA